MYVHLLQSGAIVAIRIDTFNEGKLLCINEFLLFIRGIGLFRCMGSFRDTSNTATQQLILSLSVSLSVSYCLFLLASVAVSLFAFLFCFCVCVCVSCSLFLFYVYNIINFFRLFLSLFIFCFVSSFTLSPLVLLYIHRRRLWGPPHLPSCSGGPCCSFFSCTEENRYINSC